MRFRNFAISLLLAAVLLSCIAPSAKAQNVFVTVPAPHASVPNRIIDFYAGGTSDSYSLRVSSQGGTLSLSDYLAMNLMPWGYVTAQWTAGRVYIIFLVNVTETNFRIGFLYLTNSSDQPFLLRLFDYGSDNINTWTFQGAQHVYNRTLPTSAVELPKLHFAISTTATNDLYALGPRLHLTSQEGLLLNGTSSLKIHPLLNQLFSSPTDYNEAWSLLEDDAGNYYFAILYMQNNDSSHVIIEHQLRLNDYRRLDGQTVDAKWSKGAFDHQVTVRTPLSNLTVNIDGFPFQTNNNGVAFTNVPNGVVTVEAPNEISASANSKIKFSTWSKYGTSNPLTVLVNSTLDVAAKYDEQYSLTVSSTYGTTQGTGWYSRGSNATFSVQNVVDYGNATRRVFQHWEGDSNSTMSQAWAILKSPMTVAAAWKTQFEVTVSTTGLAENLESTALIGGDAVTLNGSAVYTRWVDANQQLSINVQSTEIQGSTNNYVFSELTRDSQPFTGSLQVDKPVNVQIVYTQKPKLATALSLHILPTVTAAGYPISITGSIDGISVGSGAVDLQYSSENSGWQELATLQTSQNGAFAYTWQPSTPGNYSIKAYWAGDSTHSSASQVVGIRVVGSTLPIVPGSNTVTQILQAGLGVAKQIPYLSALVRLAASLMTLGYILTGLVIPGGSPMIGYLIGSTLVGFVYVFPVSAISVIIRAARSRRRPSLIWLTPLLTVWSSSMALVILSPNLVIAPALLTAAQILLIVSNAFAVPMLTAYRLARIVT